jgi:hypothetical protein
MIVGDTVNVPVLSRDERGSRRGTEGIHHEGIAKAHTLGGEPIEVRGLEPREAAFRALFPLHHPEGVPALVVGEHVDEVRLAGGLGRLPDAGTRGDGQGEGKEAREAHRGDGSAGGGFNRL